MTKEQLTGNLKYYYSYFKCLEMSYTEFINEIQGLLRAWKDIEKIISNFQVMNNDRD